MAYDVSYDYYKDTYKGVLITSQDAFDRLSRRAAAYLNMLTRGKAASFEPEESVWDALCAVADEYQKTEDGGELISQTVGSWSRAYAKSAKTDTGRYFEAAQLYLPGLVKVGDWI